MTYRKFIILSSPRSGTHMLRSSLAGHPRAICLAEMFNPHWNVSAPFTDDTSASELLERHIWTPDPPGVDALGFTIHRRGAPLGNRPDTWDVLALEPDLHVIHLRRESLLRRYLSFRVMKEDKKGPVTPKEMTATELRSEFSQWTRDYEDARRRFSHCPSLEVSYEELRNDASGSLERIQKFLGLPQLDLAPTTQANPPRRLRSVIANFEALAADFEGTPWHEQFKEGLPRFRASGKVEL